MKNLNKFGAFALTLSVGAIALGTAPYTGPVLKASTTPTQIIIEDFATTYSGYEDIVIPYGKISTDVWVCPDVYATNGIEIADIVADDNFFTFPALYSSYRVEYAIGDSVKTFVINVELTEPNVFFADNVERFLPSKSIKNTSILIPYPSVTDTNGETIKNSLGEDLTDIELANSFTITVTAPNGEILTDSTTNEEGRFYTTETVYQTQDETTVYFKAFEPKMIGTYTVKYSFKANSTSAKELTQTIEISNTFETDRDITFTLDTTMPTAVLGVTSQLPTVTVKDTTNNLGDIEAFVSVTAKHINTNGTLGEAINITDFEFTPTESGNYIISYTVTDFFGNVAPVANYQIRSVTDSQNPANFMLVNAVTAYDVATATSDTLIDAGYLLKSKVATNEEMIIPAVFVTDNITSLDNLTITRTVKAKYSSGTATTIEGDFNQNSTHTFTSAGTYVLTYSATDENDNQATKTYEIIVRDSYTDVKAPTVTFATTLPSYVRVGDVVSFATPSAIDYIEEGSTSIGDTRLNSKVYYFKGDTLPLNVDGITINYDELTEISKDEDSTTTMSFTVPASFAGGDILSIVVISTDDYGNYEPYIVFTDVVNDNSAPQFEIFAEWLELEYFQNATIIIPDAIIIDNDNSIVSVNIEVYNKYGNKVTVRNMEQVAGTNDLTISNASFVASESGQYDIIITVRDYGNNVTSAYKSLTVTQTTEPVINLSTTSMTAELGDVIDLDIYSVYSEGVLISNPDVEITLQCIEGSGSLTGLNTFEASTVGRFNIIFTYTEGSFVVSKTLNVVYDDTTAPVLSFDNGEPVSQVRNASTTADPVTITLPRFTATDNSGDLCTLSVEVTLTTSSGTEDITVTDYQFVPLEEGVYTVVYKAVDSKNNEATATYTITVGDQEGPVIDLGDNSINLPSTMKLNETLVIDKTIIEVSDNYDTDLTVNNIVVTLRNSSGTPISNNSRNGYSFLLGEVGSYTLTYRLTDSKDNTTTITQTITVSADEVEETEQSDIGMVLAILLSLMVLAGVIVYFFKPEKNNKPIKK